MCTDVCTIRISFSWASIEEDTSNTIFYFSLSLQTTFQNRDQQGRWDDEGGSKAKAKPRGRPDKR